MQTYVIIGASSGIGLTLAKILTADNHRVIGTFNSSERLPDSQLLSYHQLNVLDDNPPIDFIPEVIDGLVYCPGSINLKPFARIRPADFVADYNLQVVGACGPILHVQGDHLRFDGIANGSVVILDLVSLHFLWATVAA